MALEDRDNIRLYLLGRLPEPQREALSARVLEDDATFELACDVENDLIDALAHGELDPAEAAEVRRLAGQPRLAFSRALARRASANTYRGPKVVLTFVAIAAVLLVGLITAFYTLSPARKRAMEQMVAASRPVAAMFTFSVPPGTVRGSSENITRVKIPAGTEQVNIRLEIEPGGDQATLRTAGGKTIQATPVRSGGSELTVPASSLPAGRYEIAVTAKGEPQNFHYFEVE